MTKTFARTFAVMAACAASIPVLLASQDQQRQADVIRRSIELVRSDVIVRDRDGRFVPDLKKEEFVISEDGVLQEISTLVL